MSTSKVAFARFERNSGTGGQAWEEAPHGPVVATVPGRPSGRPATRMSPADHGSPPVEVDGFG